MKWRKFNLCETSVRHSRIRAPALTISPHLAGAHTRHSITFCRPSKPSTAPHLHVLHPLSGLHAAGRMFTVLYENIKYRRAQWNSTHTLITEQFLMSVLLRSYHSFSVGTSQEGEAIPVCFNKTVKGCLLYFVVFSNLF